ncbi:MAG: hypothetical protein E7473_02565 [Ruminococcaceae bacterium]|nr:hypothetical protein [Oscillospiraceae bacterium]
MKLKTKDIAVFGMLGALLYASKLAMEAFPNIHILAPLIVSLTIVYRCRALYPIYIFVFLMGLFGGFSMWWIPYLYVWTILWGVVMLLPKKMPKVVAVIVYMVICSLHGFLFGILYAPAQALMFGLSFEEMLVWIAAGALFDTVHGVSNFFCGALVLPVAEVLKRLSKK